MSLLDEPWIYPIKEDEMEQYSRTGDREAKDREDRARRPFDLLLKLKGSRSEWHWGRFADAGRAHAEGHELLHEKRPNYFPFGRRCTGYRVVDTRTNQVVSDPALVELVSKELAA